MIKLLLFHIFLPSVPESLMKHVGIKDKPKVVDITRKVGTAETLTEARINCTTDEKVTTHTITHTHTQAQLLKIGL